MKLEYKMTQKICLNLNEFLLTTLYRSTDIINYWVSILTNI